MTIDPASTTNAEGSGRARSRWGARHRPWWRRWAVIGSLVGLLLVSYVGATFVQVWQASGNDDTRSADAIVVLGAAQYDGQPSPVLEGRLDHAFDLFQEGLAPMIVVTGGRRDGDRFTEATTGYNYLRERGVDDEAIRKEVKGHTTYESLAAVARFLGAEGIDDVVLVSSASHTKRLSQIASAVDLDAAISPAPGPASLRSLVRETVAVSVGRLVGYRRLERFDR